MITATLKNNAIDLPVDFNFDIVKKSQILSFDKIGGDYCPSISFPNTERNRALFLHPNRFELKRDGIKEYPGFELRHNGWLIIQGDLVLPDGFNGFVRGEIGNIAAANVDKNITDYELPRDVVFHNKITVNPNDDDYVPSLLVNQFFFKDLTDVYNIPAGSVINQTILQYYHSRCGYLVNQKSAGYLVNFYDELLNTSSVNEAESSSGKINVISPFLYLSYTLRELLKLNGFILDSFPDELSNVIIYNNHSILDFLTVISTVIISSTDGPFEYDNVQYQLTKLSPVISPFSYTDLLPQVTLKDFILGFQNYLNYVVIFDKSKARIIDRNEVITGEADDLDSFFVNKWYLGEKKNVALEYKMKTDSNDAFFGDLYQDLSDRESDFGDDVENLDILYSLPKPKMGELRRVINVNRIYENRLGKVTDDNGLEIETIGWFFISIDFQNYKYNDEEGVAKDVETIETSFSTVADPNMAAVRQFGRCSLRKNSEASFTPRLLFDVNGIAKNNNDDLLLNWRDSNGLIEKRWKYFAEFWAHRQPVTGYFRLPANILHNFDINKKKRTRQGEFLIEKMTTRVNHNGIGATKIEGYKVD